MKSIYKIYWAELDFEYLRGIAALFDVRLRVRPKLSKNSGFADLETDTVTITYVVDENPLITEEIISTFFHELAHIIIKREGRFPVYNYLQPFSRRAYRATAWRAEMYTDKRAKELMADFFVDVEYVAAYSPADKDQFLASCCE